MIWFLLLTTSPSKFPQKKKSGPAQFKILKKKKKHMLKNGKSRKDCTVKIKSFSWTWAVLTDFSGLLLGMYQQYTCVCICVF